MHARQARPLAGKRIGIFGKGGCGKSTFSVLFARALRAVGYEVVLLDADSTNIGLCAALGITRRPRSLIDCFGGMVFAGGSVTCPVDDPTPLPDAELELGQIPDEMLGLTDEGIKFLEAGKVAERGPGAGCDGPISKIARDLRVSKGSDPPVTVADFKAGLEDSARGVITGLNWALVVVDPTLSAVQVALQTKRTIEHIRAGALPSTDHLDSPSLIELAHGLYRQAKIQGFACVLNRIPDSQTEEILRRRLAKGGIDPIGTIPVDETIARSWLRGTRLRVGHPNGAAAEVVDRLEGLAARPTVGWTGVA